MTNTTANAAPKTNKTTIRTTKKAATTERRSGKILNGHPGLILAKLASPMVLGILAIISIDMADTYYLGQYSTEALAAISFAFPVSYAVVSLAIGLGAGATSVLSRTLGEGNLLQARLLASYTLILAIIMAITLSAAGLGIMTPLFRAMGAEPALLPLITDYMFIWFVTFPLVVIPMVSNSLIRASGNMVTPAMVMVVAAIVNVVLDPIFIFGRFGVPELGIEGAAIASGIARASSLVISLYVIFRREHLLAVAGLSTKAMLAAWRQVLHVGLPAAGSSMINPIAIGCITAILASFGSDVVAAYGVATRIEMFLVIPMLALSAAVSPFMGQNWGAGKPARVQQGLLWGIVFCLGWSLLCALGSWLAAAWVTQQFTPDIRIANVAKEYLQLVSFSFVGYGVVITVAGTLNAIGRPLPAVVASAFRILILYVPLAWLLSKSYGITGVFYGTIIANVVGGMVAVVVAYCYTKSNLCPAESTNKEPLS